MSEYNLNPLDTMFSSPFHKSVINFHSTSLKSDFVVRMKIIEKFPLIKFIIDGD